jgi:pantoate--beta-alanine ligase
VEVTPSGERFRAACEEARAGGRSVGLVPTMGALHQGHGRLIKAARDGCGFVALSIFVNPLQFGAAEDLAAYPRQLDRDLAIADSLRCDLAFTPDEAEMYPGGKPEITVDPGPLGDRLEGASRPGHFRGVLTVVAKLFNLGGPCRAYFGEKDAQQLALIRRMAAGLDFPVEVTGCPIVREIDGLALSSRNAYLEPEQRAAASVLFDALSAAATLARRGDRRADVLRAEMAKRIGAEPLARLDYVAVVDDRTWEDVDELAGPARALVAAKIGSTRLIDNLMLPWEGGSTVENSPGSE